MKKILPPTMLFTAFTVVGQRKITTLPRFIGLKTTNLTSFLTIEGDEKATVSSTVSRFFLGLNSKSNHSSSVVVMEMTSGTNSGRTLLAHHSPTYLFPGLDEYADFGQLYSRGAGLILRSGSAEFPSGVIKFMTGTTGASGSLERMRIDMNGNVGIGTKTLKTKIHVSQGDVYLDNRVRRIILASPDGNCWRVTVNNTGNLQNSQIVCPN